MGYIVEWDSHAERAFGKLAPDAQRAVLTKGRDLATNPRPPGSRKLKGARDAYRLRVGEYRVLYEVTDAALVVWVVEIGPRKSVYKGL
jgi:mRNA interferase RelE/StbE